MTRAGRTSFRRDRGAAVVAARVVAQIPVPLLDAGPLRPADELHRRRARLRRHRALPLIRGRHLLSDDDWAALADGITEHRVTHCDPRRSVSRTGALARDVGRPPGADADEIATARRASSFAWPACPARRSTSCCSRQAKRCGRRARSSRAATCANGTGGKRLCLPEAVPPQRRSALARGARVPSRDARHRSDAGRRGALRPDALLAVDRRPGLRDLTCGTACAATPRSRRSTCSTPDQAARGAHGSACPSGGGASRARAASACVASTAASGSVRVLKSASIRASSARRSRARRSASPRPPRAACARRSARGTRPPPPRRRATRLAPFQVAQQQLLEVADRRPRRRRAGGRAARAPRRRRACARIAGEQADLLPRMVVPLGVDVQVVQQREQRPGGRRPRSPARAAAPGAASRRARRRSSDGRCTGFRACASRHDLRLAAASPRSKVDPLDLRASAPTAPGRRRRAECRRACKPRPGCTDRGR